MLTLRPLEEGTISRRGISIEVASQRASVTLEGVSKDTSRRKGKLSVARPSLEPFRSEVLILRILLKC